MDALSKQVARQELEATVRTVLHCALVVLLTHLVVELFVIWQGA